MNFKLKTFGLENVECVTYDQNDLLAAVWKIPNSSKDNGLAAPKSGKSENLLTHDENGNLIKSQIELGFYYDLQESMQNLTCNLLSNKSESEKMIIEKKTELLNKLFVTISIHVGCTNDYQELYQLAVGMIKCSHRFKTEIEVFNSVACVLMMVQYLTKTDLDERSQKIVEMCSLKLKPHHLDYLDVLFKMKRKWHVNYYRDGWGEQLWLPVYLTNFKTVVRWLCEIRTRSKNDGTGLDLVTGSVLSVVSDMSLVYAILIDTGMLEQFKKMSAEVVTINFVSMVGKAPNCTCITDLCGGYLSEGINVDDPGEVLLAAYTCYLVVHWNNDTLNMTEEPLWFKDFICLATEVYLMTDWAYYEIQIVDLVIPVYLPDKMVNEGRTKRALSCLPVKLERNGEGKRFNYDLIKKMSKTNVGFCNFSKEVGKDELLVEEKGFDLSEFNKIKDDDLLNGELRTFGIRQFGQCINRRRTKTKSFQMTIDDFIAEES